MKVLKKSVEKDSSGSITLVLQDPEDLWHTYNLILPGDVLRAQTVRRVVSETTTGTTTKQTHKTTLSITCTETYFDTSTDTLRVNGKVCVENDIVKRGAFHSITLELHRQFTITKENWDSIALGVITDACDVTKTAEIAAIVMQEGLANLCLISGSMTVIRQRIECNIPKKRRGTTTDYDRGVASFHSQVYEGILRHFDFNVVKVLIIASPGFVKDAFYKYLIETAIRTDTRVIIENKSKITLAHSASGHKHALAECLGEESIQNRLQETRYVKELRAIADFYKVLGKDTSQAFYGYEYVVKAADNSAISIMMVSDSLFRSADLDERKKYIVLVENVRKAGGTVFIFSAMHTTGEQVF